MFKKILIANRGEIALRVICACRELGIKTVAVYSEADENSLHVRFADEDVCIGPARSADSYLSVPADHQRGGDHRRRRDSPGLRVPVRERVPRRGLRGVPHQVHRAGAQRHPAARRQGARAPGDEEGRRARSCPAATARSTARRRREDRQGPRVSRHHQGGGRRRRPRHARHPRGRRAEQRAEDGHSARPRPPSASATSTSRSTSRTRATSSSRCSAITTARSCTSASASARSSGGTRSCSRKGRRSRSPRRCAARWAATVVDAARAVQYTNAGTFEFLLDDKGNFYFLEVNTRVQVEHPVTEFITGVDIVKEQIRIAAGERLSFRQSDVTFSGHAIECRINAEDPETFAPSPGVIHAFSVPGGPGVRVDTFAHSECTDLAVLRFDDRQDHRARPRSAGSHRADAPHARDDGHRGHQDVDPAAPEDPGGSGFRRRPPRAPRSWSGSPFEEEAAPQRTRRRRVLAPALYPIIDIDASAGTAASSRWRSPPPACAAARGSCSFATRRPASRAPRAGRRLVALARPHRRRPGRRQRSRGHRRLAGADGVHVGQDDLPVDDGAADRSARTRSSACRRTTDAQMDAAAADDGDLHRRRPDLRDSRRRTRAITARGLALVRMRRDHGASGRRHRRDHARTARLRCSRRARHPSP